MRELALSIIAFLTFSTLAWAQPANDECTNPIIIPNVLNYCSPVGAYTNVGATPSAYGPATCFGNTQNDVWFAFTALATDVTITVRGATPQAPGGTLQRPQLAIYFGNCGGTINQLECQTTPVGVNVVEGYQGGLFVGSTYLVRIQGANGQTGTFQICINNYNPPVDPQSDCPQAAILCDKSPFVVQSVVGAGQNIAELNDATCFSNGGPGNYETNSTWFVWTCAQPGTLEFTLTPLNITDDLDFVVYRLPNGIGNCQNKQVVRCMAAGDFFYPSPCMGPTGLRAGSTDLAENAGCGPGKDNFLAPLQMQVGETYALVVNNFTSTGNGFSIEFGGSGQFLGPTADFNTIPSAVCLGVPVQVIDASSFPIGSITSWSWSFGANASPQTASGPGPHNVTFNNPGQNPIVLTLETNLGCKVTKILNATIFPDVEIDKLIAAPDCNGATNGRVTISNITSGTPPYQYSWNSGPFTSSNFLDNLGVGTYTLRIRDANNCESDFSIDVSERVLTADAIVTKPLCTGDANGVITLNITNGKPPILFNWGSGNVPNNSQGGYAAGIYTITAVDDVLCQGVFNVTVTDNPPLQLVIDTINISCFGADDGAAIVEPSGGVGNYTYQWSNSRTDQEVDGLEPGQYGVTVTDANGCTITGSVFIEEPGDVGINLLRVVDLLCNGVPTGQIDVAGVGGRPAYSYSTDGINYFSASPLTNLPAGNYWVKVKDSAGCIDSVFATVGQPPALLVAAEPSDTLLDLGFTVNINTVTAPPFRPVVFEWTPPLGLSDPTSPNPSATAISSQIYVVKITDQDGCVAYDTVNIRVNNKRPVYFPNVFAPDKNYPNDYFTGFSGPAAEQLSLLRVFDRWGSLVFERRDFPLNEPILGWDGTYKGQKMTGVFTWYALVRFVDQRELQYEGSVTVVR